jgi:hypothetical protein
VTREDNLLAECKLWPVIHYKAPGDWCGQHKDREKTKKEKEEKPILDTKSFILGYAKEFKDIFGAAYVIDWVKDTQAAKTLLTEHDPETARSFCLEFLEHPPQWNLDNKCLNLYFVPGIRTKLSLQQSNRSGASIPRLVAEGWRDHGSATGWPDYVDYVNKGGDKTFEEWMQ